MTENFLKSQGWLTLKMPQEGIRPLEILVRDSAGSVTRKNSRLDALFKPNTLAPPAMGEDKKVAADVMGKASVDLSASLQFGLLDSLVKILKAGVDANTSIKNANEVTFDFKNALVNEIDELSLDEYIQDATLNEKAKTFGEYLAHDDIYLITAIMKSNSFSLAWNKNGSTSVGADINVTDQAKVNADFSRTSTKEASMSWDGNEYLVFAVKAVRLQYVKPKWFSKAEAGYRLLNADPDLVVKHDEDIAVERLVSSAPLIELQ